VTDGKTWKFSCLVRVRVQKNESSWGRRVAVARRFVVFWLVNIAQRFPRRSCQALRLTQVRVRAGTLTATQRSHFGVGATVVLEPCSALLLRDTMLDGREQGCAAVLPLGSLSAHCSAVV
jgi:hypothetical protein